MKVLSVLVLLIGFCVVSSAFASQSNVDSALLKAIIAKRGATQQLYSVLKGNGEVTGTDCEKMQIEAAAIMLENAEISLFTLEVEVGRRHKVQEALSDVREKISDAGDAIDDLPDDLKGDLN